MTDRKINALRENDLIQDDIVKINQLRIENIDLITGFENENIYVKYERVSPLIFETDQDVSI